MVQISDGSIQQDLRNFGTVGGFVKGFLFLPHFITKLAGSFNCTISHFMMLTASLGAAAKYWSASVIFVCPVHREKGIAVFRIARFRNGTIFNSNFFCLSVCIKKEALFIYIFR